MAFENENENKNARKRYRVHVALIAHYQNFILPELSQKCPILPKVNLFTKSCHTECRSTSVMLDENL